ncbi:calcium-binding protein, partial [Neptuniibacter sp.]|uniref:calcium-binding protein n=1 Tax=Neptuniibacter sp. TaxID=1962643 RepID=UPI00337E61D9|nr:calcium-binding protein [Neptuniibacter sp.]
NQDGDKIILRGHTVEIADVTQGEDEGGDYSLIHVRSQQGDGGGAHDEDSLGTIKVYGDEVTADDINVVKKNVFDGIDIFEPIPEDEVPNLIYGSNNADSLEGTEGSDNIHGRGGKDTILGNDGDDFIFAGSSNDLVMAGEGNDWIEGGRGNDYLDGGLGDDFVVADSGDDMMVGGAGSDHFVIENGSAGATILDWQDGQDLFDFSRMDTVESLDDLDIFQMGPQMATVSFINENEDEVSVMLIGQTSFALDANDFVF